MDQNKKNKKSLLTVIIVIAVIVAGLAVYFLGFYKNGNVRNAEAAIEAIGTVTLESEGLIEEAEKLYGGLTDSEKSRVDNLQKLEDARAEYKDLCDREAAAETDGLIAGIGVVSRDNESKLRAARASYDALTDDQKKYVKKLDVLEKAEQDYELLDAKECEELISAIGDAAESPDILLPIAIAAARSAYDALSPAHKKEVSNYASLEAAEKAYEDYAQKRDALRIKEEHTERMENIDEYIKTCQTVTYAQLISNPDTYEGKDISITLDILKVEAPAFLKAGYIAAKPSGGRDTNFISLLDKRSVKKPELAEKMTVTVYGVFNGIENVKTYAEGTGLLGTDLFAQVDSETMVPEISVYYTSADDKKAIDEQPTVTEVFNYIEDGLEIAGDITEALRQIPWDN